MTKPNQPPADRLLPYVPRLALEWAARDRPSTWLAIEGSMVFADISGFTRMSERLARRGRIGAEEVTEVMNETFSRLLGIAYDHGGGLLKFGGDALLLFFDGADHAARGAAGAWRMRAALREHGRLPTSAGAIALRISVGMHSGDFNFFLPGRSHRELIVTGPAASRTVEMEQAAGAGRILLSPECAALLPARCRGRAQGPGVSLKAAPDAPAGVPVPASPPDGIDLTGFVPVALRERLLSGVGEPEHRQATIAFVRFDGTDAGVARRGEAWVCAAVGGLIEAAQAAAEASGVTFLATDVDRDGGKIILVAGVPTSTADDEERMLRCVRAIADGASDLPVRIGVNRGRIFAGDVGAPHRRTFTVMGDAVNLAARLMTRAGSGEIVATPDLVSRSRTSFATTPLEPFKVKGKSQPVRAVAVGAVAGTRRATATRRLPFVGREREIAAAGEALAQVRAGRGHLLDIVGEAGIGKTRLLEEIRALAPDFRVLAASADPYAASTPYYPFRTLLRDVLEVEPSSDATEMTALLTDRTASRRPDLVPLIPLLAVPLDVGVRATIQADQIDPRFRKARIHDVVGEVLAAFLDTPTMLVFEDATWLDDASRELLVHLAGRHPAQPWLLVATRRPHTFGFAPEQGMRATTIKLEPLDDRSAATLAGAAAGDEPIPPQRLAAFAERAGGNPLFLQELVAATGEPGRETLPDSIEAVVTEHIDTLASQDRLLLRYASVIGSSFSPSLVADVVGGDADAGAGAWRRLGEFLDAEPDGRYRFRHAMFRDVAYEGLPFRRRRLMHSRAGDIIERRAGANLGPVAEILSLHFHRAASYEKSWRYSSMAGDGARDKDAVVEAADLYRRALDAARRLGDVPAGDVARVAEALGDVCELGGMYADAAGAYGQARRLTRSERGDRGDLLMKEGVLRERAGRYSEALRWYTRGLRAAGAGGGAEVEGRLSLAAAGVRLRQGRFAECVRLAERVVAAGPPDAQLAHAYYLLHLAHTSTGNRERARYRDLPLPIYERLGDVQGQGNVLNNLGIDAYYEGRWSQALDLYRRGRDARARAGDTIGAAQTAHNIAEILSDQGRVAEAEAAFRETLAVFRASGYRLGVLLASANLARIRARSGGMAEAADAATTLETILAEFREIGAESFVLQTEAWIAECALAAGDPDKALARAGAALGGARAAGSTVLLAMLHRLIGAAHLQRNRTALAQDALDEALRIAVRAGALFEQALTHRAWAALAARTGHADGPRHDTEARALFARLGVATVASPSLRDR